jgi:hypothetical protein
MKISLFNGLTGGPSPPVPNKLARAEGIKGDGGLAFIPTEPYWRHNLCVFHLSTSSLNCNGVNINIFNGLKIFTAIKNVHFKEC